MINTSFAAFFIPLPPLFAPTLFLMAGISTYVFAHTSSLALYTCSFAVLAIALVGGMCKPAHKLSIFLCGIFFMLGIARTHYVYKQYEEFPFSEFKNPVTIRGTVTNIVSLPESRLRQSTTLDIHDITTDDQSYPVHMALTIYSHPLHDLHVSDTINLHRVLIKPIKNNDFKLYLMREGILTTLFLQKVDYSLVHRPSFSLRRLCFQQKMRIYNALHHKLSKPAFTFFAALFLGDRAHNKRYVNLITDKFQYWGILHYLARAGLHMVIFTFMWEMIFRMIPLPFIIKHIILTLLYILYFLFSWPSIPFIRAFSTVILYKACLFLNRQSHFLSLLTLICSITLLLNPLQLCALDFQLSFFLTFALGWLNQSTSPISKY